ncbi:hypothetical protein A1O3_04575 [Capronia epimyces CBS 606.96]|uniref:Aminoglycoside phosphotransferase domain-containing protein n=1 Tax=Capronia epimyces CBS 606.96 TaxID=1182542 RepID=W9YZ93_9EURO|nr:uncharacterized protein A1O3_04575 [Capronia epimyces CBS 606.96]EXJ87614.1 hypothetical protein A1O3_04575 [Capronia epimyces CBS 606.96]
MACATPPFFPNYDVHFSDSTIQTILLRSLPAVKSEHMSIEPLPFGNSFNNRIYFVNLSEPTTFPRPQWTPTGCDTTTSVRVDEASSFVLKVVSRPGAPKPQNEVACLLLLERYCPSVPTPRVIAWSDDGKRIRTPLDPRGSRARSPSWFLRRLTRASRQNGEMEKGQMETKGRGWILMTRVSGRIINKDDLTGVHGDAIMIQMAELVATWRKQMPPARAIGNLRLMGRTLVAPRSATLYDRSILPGLDVYVDGVIVTEPNSTPLNTSLKYHTHKLTVELRRLKTAKVFEQTREPVSELVQHFIRETLPRLSMFSHTAEEMIFTHDDLSPRNVLVSATPSAIEVTAVIDFESAGFFPAPEEFGNTVENIYKRSWTLHAYEQFLSTLSRLEALPESLSQSLTSSPSDGTAQIAFGGPEFHQAVLLSRIAGNIAPWWVKQEVDTLSDEEVKRQLTEARARVEKSVESLEAMVSREPRP